MSSGVGDGERLRLSLGFGWPPEALPLALIGASSSPPYGSVLVAESALGALETLEAARDVWLSLEVGLDGRVDGGGERLWRLPLSLGDCRPSLSFLSLLSRDGRRSPLP